MQLVLPKMEKKLRVVSPTNLLRINFQDYRHRCSIEKALRTGKYKLNRTQENHN